MILPCKGVATGLGRRTTKGMAVVDVEGEVEARLTPVAILGCLFDDVLVWRSDTS